MSKKIFLTLITAIVFGLSASAQMLDTTFYYMKNFKDADWPPINELSVSTRDSADFYRMILPPDTNSDKNLFIVNDFYKNGKPKMIGKTTNRGCYPELNGPCIKYFPNGRRESVENYEKGKLKGYMIKYYPNGKSYLTGMYNDSSRLIVDECMDSTGNSLAKNGNGRYIKYDETFKQIQSQGDISNGLENGEWHGVLGDTIKYTCMYIKGVGKNGISHNINGKEYAFLKAQEEPMFKGGMTAFYGYLSRQIRYPKAARDARIQGKVFLTFVIDRDGALSNMRVVDGIGGGCDEESLRGLSLSPKWLPCKLYGVQVRVRYTMPISFTLSYEDR